MALFWGVVAFVLHVYLFVILARLVVEITRQFARSWRPIGVTAVGLELVYSSTDPPIKVLRRLIPSVRLGAVSLDLSITILLIGVVLLEWLASSFT